MWTLQCTRVIRKVTQTQHQSPRFRHTRVRFKKDLQKSTLAFNGGGSEAEKTINFGGKLSFILSFLFPEHHQCCYIYFHCSYLYNYYYYSRTLCIECWVSYWDLIKYPYFTDTTERGDRGWKEPQRQGEDRVTLWITLLWRSELGKRTWQK